MNDANLILAAAALSHRAPDDWARFITALAAYADGRRNECISAPLVDLQVAQGRAQASMALSKLLAECRTTAAKIETKNQKPLQPR